MQRIIYILLLLFHVINIFGQEDTVFPVLKREAYIDSLEVYNNLYGKQKTIHEDFKLEVLTALAHYPELKDVNITFRYKRFWFYATMKAGPRPYFFFQSRDNRHYTVFINKNKGRKPGVNVKSELTFNACVGIFGHELAHIVDYTDESTLQLVLFGIAYSLSGKSMTKTEHATDLSCIEHGLGYALYELKINLRNRPVIKEKYKRRIKRHYLSPEEVLIEIDRMKGKHPAYR